MITAERPKQKYTWTKGFTPPIERVLARIDTTDPEVCWLWPGSTYGNGYGSIKIGSRQDGTRRNTSTHIVTYEALVGPVPEGLELDHLCRVRLCCNPFHLEPVTHSQNMERMPETYKALLRDRLVAARTARWVL